MQPQKKKTERGTCVQRTRVRAFVKATSEQHSSGGGDPKRPAAHQCHRLAHTRHARAQQTETQTQTQKKTEREKKRKPSTHLSKGLREKRSSKPGHGRNRDGQTRQNSDRKRARKHDAACAVVRLQNHTVKTANTHHTQGCACPCVKNSDRTKQRTNTNERRVNQTNSSNGGRPKQTDRLP